MAKERMLKLFIFLQILLKICLNDEYTNNAETAQGSTNFAVTHEGNAFYIGGSNNKIVYRYEMLQQVKSPTNTYPTSHSLNIVALALSKYQYYLASGADDYRIQIRLVKNNSLICTFWHHNQVREMVFDPNSEQTLYSTGLDDKIRKWNISTCQQTAEIDPGESPQSLAISPDGSQLAYGTLYGDVGYIDPEFTTITTSANAHLLCVFKILYTNNQFYVSISHDAVMKLWKNGVQIDRLTGIFERKILECSLFVKAINNATYRAITCTGQSNKVFTYKVTNTSITRFTDHGFSGGTPVWLIGHHMDETSLQWILGLTNGLRYNYIYDAKNQQCSPHTGRITAQQKCTFCWYMISGCHFCDDQVTPTTCMVGTYQSGAFCLPCSSDCSQCSSATSCTHCLPGYQEIGSSKKCRLTTGNQLGCFELTNSGSYCKSAVRGYYVKNNQAYLCNNQVAGCMQCESTDGSKCYGCQTGYYLSSSSCIRCNATISGCIACANNTECIACSVAFKYSGPNLHCSNCHQYCLTCGPFYDTCLTCSGPISHREINGTACQCIKGYYQNATDAVCVLCSSVLNNCFHCTNNTQCLQCKKDYYIVISGGITSCQVCNPFCQKCVGTSQNCTTCNLLTYKRVLVGSNCQCDNGYVSLGGSVACYSCSIMNDGCNSCTSDQYCNSCDVGYYLNIVNATYQLCRLCPYYCPDCSQNGASSFVCNSCPGGSHRTIVAGLCQCDTGYFDDNLTVVCERCSDVLQNCDICNSRRKCISCSPGLFPDQSNSVCSACRPSCLSCGLYFTECTSCDPSQNRILISGQCACKQYAYEQNSVCVLCSTAIPHCNSCQNPYLCTGCEDGYTLQDDLKKCIDCAKQMNGCQQCTTTTNCTTCSNGFSLINDKCRCPNTKYTSYGDWGSCVDYIIEGLSSSLGIQMETHQFQNNSLLIYIRFRAKVLYTLNKTTSQAMKVSINGVDHPLTVDHVDKSRINIRVQMNQSYYEPNVSVTFLEEVFYNQKLLTLDNHTYTQTPRRLYNYEESEIKTYQTMKNILVYIFMVFKWVFFGMTIIGLGHLIFPFVTIIQLLPIFLMLNMSLPSNLAAVLQGMLSFQVASIVPLFDIDFDSTVYFPPMTFDFYLLRDYVFLGKVGDFVLILIVNILTKFDQGIIRMFPTGRIRRYLYQSLVRRGYAVMSLCILSVQPSLLIVTGAFIKSTDWQIMGEVINYCCCLFLFGFYVVYNFNHSSNLMGSKQLRNIDNDHCYNDLNPQQAGTNKAIFIVLISDIWLAGSLFLVGAMPYFVGSLILLLARLISQAKVAFYIGKIQLIFRTLENILLLCIYVIMFVFYLGEELIQLTNDKAQSLGLGIIVMIFLYLLFCLIEKIVFNLKLGSEWMKTKKIANENDDVIFAQRIQEADDHNQVESDSSFKNRAFINNTSNVSKNQNVFNNTQYSQEDEGKTNNPSAYLAPDQGNPKPGHNNTHRSMNNNSMHNPKNNNKTNQSDQRKTDNYFSKPNQRSENLQPKLRIKSANTSKYAKNHLQLRYKAHEQTVLNRIDQQFED